MTHFSHDYEQGIKDERERIIKLIQTVYQGQTFADHACRIIDGDAKLLRTLGWGELLEDDKND